MVKIHRSKDSQGEDGLYEEFFKCPSCKNQWVQKDSNYCHDCGNKIKWIDYSKEKKEAIRKEWEAEQVPIYTVCTICNGTGVLHEENRLCTCNSGLIRISKKKL